MAISGGFWVATRAMANIIQEKAKAGLKIAEKIEAHLFELKHKHIQNDA